MNQNSPIETIAADPRPTSPILIVPYMWIGDFVRGHTAVRLLKARWPNRPVDLLSTTLCAPLADYMPGVRKTIVYDLPRGRIALDRQRELAALFRREGYGTALMMPRTWKSALAPTLAGIPERIGFIGEVRFGLVTDLRRGERTLPRMVDKMAALVLPRNAVKAAHAWPVPQLEVPEAEIKAWRAKNNLGDGAAIALAPGAVGPSKRWTYYAEAARELAERGFNIWIVGGPGEKQQAAEIVAAGGPRVRDLTGTDLRNGILALAAASEVISNDSGLLHVAGAIGTPSIGIFGPTSPYHWAPLNGLAATMKCATNLPCQPCHKPVCTANDHACMRDITAREVVDTALKVVAEKIKNRPVSA
ncbi:lipopolysaccharide heptosyltransferase II [Afipia carboxidovorans]|uniref:lipopolysaccharide heptosyltransferase II n=1 Tax=Afipia carboxidovorans TaxID=40137 RepID=UPI0030D0F421